jgi:Tol biopolymer transport system component
MKSATSRAWVMPIAFAVLSLVLLALHTGRAYATFPGPNGRISFARFFPDTTNSTSIFTVRPDGSGQQQVTFESPNQNSVGSDWSPNGSRIAFDSDRSSNNVDDFVDVFTMESNGSDVVQLTSHAGFNGEPEYSPDSNTIVFESDRGVSGGEGIYLMNSSDGANVRRVTVTPVGFFDAFPHFSPAGNRIVFTRGNGCRPNPGSGDSGCLAAVFLVNVDGSRLTRITPWGRDTSATDWSPDGSKFVLESRFDTTFGSKVDVLVVSVDGSNLVNLTNNPPITQPPCSISDHAKFSPNGTLLVFRHTDCTGHPTLWIMNADGSGKRDTGIQLGRGGEGFPDWGSNQE